MIKQSYPMKSLMLYLFDVFLFPIAVLFSMRRSGSVFYSPSKNTNNCSILFEYFVSSGAEAFYIESQRLGEIFYRILVTFKIATSKNLFLTHGIGNLPLTFFVVRRIQLWHGIPLKKILIHDFKSESTFAKFKYLTYKFRVKYLYNFLVTGEGVAADALVSSFGIPENRVVRLGTPMLDKNHIPDSKNSRRNIIFMPSWRENEKMSVSLYILLFNELFDNYLRDNGMQFTFFPHPYDKDIYAVEHEKNSSVFTNISLSLQDPVDFIDSNTILVSDFSSALFNVSNHIPKIIFFPDYDEYQSYRGFYGYFNDLPIAKNIRQLMEALNGEHYLDIDKYYYQSEDSKPLLLNYFK